MEGEKTFFNVADLSERIAANHKHLISAHGPLPVNSELLMDQVDAQLAIAQQLSVISGTLSDLLALCKAQDTKKSKK